jgi:hypothetical protein
MADKPASPQLEPIERWTAQREVAIIVEVMNGQISVPEAARKYGFTRNEYRRWADEYHRAGVDALKRCFGPHTQTKDFRSVRGAGRPNDLGDRYEQQPVKSRSIHAFRGDARQLLRTFIARSFADSSCGDEPNSKPHADCRSALSRSAA